MGQERLWLLGVTVAATFCLLCPSLSAELVVSGRVGGSAELGCSLTAMSDGASSPNLFPLHVVEWVRLGYNVPILIKFGGYTPRVHPNYKGRVSLTQGASLLVDRLTLEDEGWFECRILLLDRATDEFRNGTWNFLSITAPPVFVKTPPTFVEVLLGESLTLSCSAHGNPKPTVSWRKDDNAVKKHDKIQVLNGTLSLSKVTRETAGMYKCHVSNSEGNLTHITQLQVKGPPVILISPEDTTMNMSQDAILQCQADAYPSNLTYEWWKEGQNVYHVESLKSRVKILVDGTLLIPGLIPEDSGNYTCVPTNGLLTPPSASAYLKVKHPARVVRMPRETYLPVGMGGTIICPVQAEPPMLFVNWTKDGDSLDLDQYPGWMVNSEGSVFIATANDDAVGMYTCTAYNSYGTMGQSEPTKVILEDPPSFRIFPRAEYLQEVGRELMIPCQAHGDPSPNITWSKVDSAPRSPFTVLLNGSLVLRPLSKDHQGAWECHATNRVATVSTGTMILVLGTSPHSVTAVSVDPGMNHANVSWEPGFDGGYTQKFTVWVKPTTRGKHEWASLPVPTSKSSLLVTGLQAATSYQFSVLPQNKLGSGPFSEIVTMRTLAAPTDPPTVLTTLAALPPPTSLSVNRTAVGVLLQWSPPSVQSPPITAFILQARQEKGDWVTLDGAVNLNLTEMIVQGLIRDSNYELRLLSRREKMISDPSESVTISTKGMEMYPAPHSLLAFVPEPLLAGVIGGVCFLFVAIILSLVTACVMSHRRERHRRKRRDDIPSAFQKSPSPQARSPADSPDSMLKMKLCPPLNFFPNSSSSNGSDRSSFDKGSRSEYQDQKKQLLSSSSPPPRYTLFESHLGGSPSPTSAIESISRGPDGRFIVQQYPEGSTPMHIKKHLKKEFPQSPGRGSGEGSNCGSFRDSPKASSYSSEKDVRQEPPPRLAVESTDSERPPHSPGRVKAMARNFSRHGCFYSDEEQGCSEALLERPSFYSDCSEKRACDSLKKYCLPNNREDIFPSLTKRARALERERLLHQAGYEPMDKDSQLSEPSTMVSQLGSEQERNNLSKCLRLVKEREEMERELESYTISRRAEEREKEQRRAKSASPLRRWGGGVSEDPIWKPQDIQLREKTQRPSSLAQQVSDYRRGCYFGNTSSPMEKILPSSSSYIQWDISPVTSPTSQVPVPSLSEGNTPRRGLVSIEDSVAGDFTHSPITQYTSLSLLSPRKNSPSPCGSNPVESQVRCLKRPTERDQELSCSKTLTDEGWKQDRKIETQAVVSRSTYPTPCSSQPSEMAFERTRHSTAEREQQAHSHNYPKPIEETNLNRRGKLSHSPSGCSTLPYDHQKTGAKVKSRGIESKAEDELSSLSLHPEEEKEGVRARSRKSDKCVFSDSPSRISPLTLDDEGESDQSNFSIARMSESLKVKIVPQPARVSPLQTSTILEYLSLPGFIEMSVDEPIEESEPAEPTWPSTQPENETLLRGEPDVVPKNWESHDQDHSEINSGHQNEVLVDLKTSIIPKLENVYNSKPCPELAYREAHMKSESSETNSRAPQVVSHEGRCSQLLLSQKRASADKQQSTQINPAQTLVSTAKSMAIVVSDSIRERERTAELLSEQPKRFCVQDNRTNKITSRITQAPMPFMKKSISIGPCRTLSGMGQPRPFLKKSISLGSQRWEHYESPRAYVSETCYRDELPHPDVRVKSYSLGRTPANLYSRPGPSWQGAVPFQPLSSHSLERSRYSDQPYITPSYLSHTYGPPVLDPSKLAEPHRHESDPRRQATVFPESTRCPLSYRETLRSIQHKYVPQDFPRPFGLPRPVARGDYIRPMDSRRGIQRPFLPRGYSWPSPYQASFPPWDREVQMELYVGVGMGKGSTNAEGRDSRAEGGRASYASQSSGRGSVGPYGHGHLRQSVSITPTLLSSPETTEESERRKAESDLREQRSKRNTSVDESYEWDATECTVGLDLLEAMKMEQAGLRRGRELRQDRPCSTTGLQDLQEKGPYSSINLPLNSHPPPRQYGRSLSEARFNALRQEFHAYRRAQESSSRDPRLTPDPDSDSGSALL
ncbi:protein turtle homolog A isoform X2 [Pygocentrus nattereri]|uniref:protein turtle homolog A isoform X2 n=1 Tax=Pygocentrus nattereri TaxID=42514 RepID=UPI0018915492|nr:protein turtle homolog A isoform X2 [Pygocentrus nattereri]